MSLFWFYCCCGIQENCVILSSLLFTLFTQNRKAKMRKKNIWIYLHDTNAIAEKSGYLFNVELNQFEAN